MATDAELDQMRAHQRRTREALEWYLQSWLRGSLPASDYVLPAGQSDGTEWQYRLVAQAMQMHVGAFDFNRLLVGYAVNRMRPVLGSLSHQTRAGEAAAGAILEHLAERDRFLPDPRELEDTEIVPRLLSLFTVLVFADNAAS